MSSIQDVLDGKGDRLSALLVVLSVPRLATYLALGRAIQAAGHLPVIALVKDISPTPEEIEGYEDLPLFLVKRPQLRDLRNVDVCFSPEQLDVVPPGAATVAIMHSLPDAAVMKESNADPRRTLARAPTMFRLFDYFCIAARQPAEHWTVEHYDMVSELYPPDFLEGRRPFLDIVPAGYPKLDYLPSKLAGAGEPDTIIYSPTRIGAGFSRFSTDGEPILKALAAAFPNHRIVLRPYPNKNDLEFATALLARLDLGERVVLDTSVTGLEHQRRCAVSVSDRSSSAITFAMSSGRPLVFVDLQAKRGAEERELAFGRSVHKVESLVAAIQHALDHPKKWRRRIQAGAEEFLYRPGQASAYLASHVPTFARRESDPEWLSVPRRAWRGAGDPEAERRHLERLAGWSQQFNVRPHTLIAQMTAEIRAHLGLPPVDEPAAAEAAT